MVSNIECDISVHYSIFFHQISKELQPSLVCSFAGLFETQIWQRHSRQMIYNLFLIDFDKFSRDKRIHT